MSKTAGYKRRNNFIGIDVDTIIAENCRKHLYLAAAFSPHLLQHYEEKIPLGIARSCALFLVLNERT